jgi:hypothetical protein
LEIKIQEFAYHCAIEPQWFLLQPELEAWDRGDSPGAALVNTWRKSDRDSNLEATISTRKKSHKT